VFSKRSFSHLNKFATIDPWNLSTKDVGQNLCQGEWVGTENYVDHIDPMTGKPMLKIPNTSMDEIQPFVDSLHECPKYGLHNPFNNKERYLMIGEVCRKTVEVMHDKEVFDWMVKCSQRAIPKSNQQTEAEVRVTRAFFENFCGDQVRFLARGFSNPGDHEGQMSQGYRFPFGPVGVIAPFNFPVEIPVL